MCPMSKGGQGVPGHRWLPMEMVLGGEPGRLPWRGDKGRGRGLWEGEGC